MSAGVREALQQAQAQADDGYAEYRQYVDSNGAAWAELGYGVSKKKFDPKGLVSLVKDNWGKIVVVASAFGIPLAAADTGAFKTVIDLFKGVVGF